MMLACLGGGSFPAPSPICGIFRLVVTLLPGEALAGKHGQSPKQALGLKLASRDEAGAFLWRSRRRHDEGSPRKIHGELFKLHNPLLLEALDAYEGCRPQDPQPRQFQRVAIEVNLARGPSLPAWAYAFTGGAAGRAVIARGRFRLC